MFPLIIEENFTYLRLRKSSAVYSAWDTNYLILSVFQDIHVLLRKLQPTRADISLFLEYNGSQFFLVRKLIKTILRI